MLSLLILTPAVWAQEETAAPAAAAPEGKLLRLDGQAQIKGPADTEFRAVSGGDMLPLAGTFRVLPGGKAQIELPNGGIILVKEFTVVQLDQIAKDQNAQISIPVGEFLIGFKAPLPSGQVFKVRTPAAVAGIRGTLFWGLSAPDLTTTFACFHDTITLEAGGKTVDLVPGMVSSTKYGEAPADPAPHSVPASYLETFAVEGNLEGLPDLLK
ncbi:MAG: hypothetical protein A3G34_09850 [Candidatus Lindowbacteria bacterium RIFCSPLOWO2_12_FULL_62_27]|nr:MAG: hypothetical protein A3G34_09850 [Candidatus Lindowbacteria bacterium RIFCSPLOWO2_12_FULL_62_27]OGH61545.1 MAG: hypothetical protein A3I06_02855 [Candidatus Lindowbacteria bacterium RIFCSPLOWO2_02_FULL_62_12]